MKRKGSGQINLYTNVTSTRNRVGEHKLKGRKKGQGLTKRYYIEIGQNEM
jgi:hypothetical protein